ncbi:3'-5' exonuclease [Jidongwangia harbinensis]|uniref:3'-5' exonuclease n=1 Tax=Jidongwangia harbinensis TaxID=2878561 RepID=UPI001CDA182D|nr:3'-5' exonuclease [Jidongwangia harbinensis]MCA2219308.1 3'-5' exonuclease [Jidongwangia harbinensis]
MRLRRLAPVLAADLHVPWREAEFCVLDLETTGLDLRRDQIVSYGAAIIAQARIHCRLSAYGEVRPGRASSVGALKVHGLHSADLAGAPPLDEALDHLIDLLSNRVLVAHSAWIERAFLDRALRSRGRRLGPGVLDTAALLRACGLTGGDGRYAPDLEAIAGRLGLPVHTPHHALGDAITTAEVFLVLATRLEQARPLTVHHLRTLSRYHRA